jgi:hypothetical protein
MSRVEWQWQDAGSGPGHMQRVLVHDAAAPQNLVQTAYRCLLTHCVACPTCRSVDEDGWANGECDEARWLYRAWRSATRDAVEGSPAA